MRCRMKDETFDIAEGNTLVLAPPATVTAKGKRVEYLALTLTASFMLESAVEANLTRTDARITFRHNIIEQDEKLNRFARDLTSEIVEQETGQEIVASAIVKQTIVHLLRRYANIRRPDELELSRAGLVDRRIRRAVELMHTHLDRELPLDEIASAAYLSPFHFSRLFKKITGIAPHAYLARLRQLQAQKLLAETDYSITTISAKVGYSSSSHFTKAFRQAMGMTPRQFRQALVQRQDLRSKNT